MEKMDQKIAKISTVLKDVSSADWKARVEAIRDLRSILGDATVITIRGLIPSLVKQIGDGRSLVMQEACETARAICFAFGSEPEFPSIADMLVRACLPIVPSSTKVMSDAAKSCLKQVVQCTTRGFQVALERFCQGALGGPGRAASYRLECVRLLDLCINEWDAEWLSRNGLIAVIENAVKKSLKDADSEVRTAARVAFTTFARTFPEEGRKSWQSMESEERARFQDLFPTISQPINQAILMSSSAKRTPFHPNARATPAPALNSTVRKPLQMLSVNATTPSSMKSRKLKEERPAPISFGLAPSAVKTIQRPDNKKVVTFRDRLVRNLVDLLGRSDTIEAKSRITSAMRDIAGIFYAHAEDLISSDFIQCESAIEMTVFSADEDICKSGMDALGMFVFALGGSRQIPAREKDDVLARLVSGTFPVALVKTQARNTVLAEAALRAIDACSEFISKNQLLAYALQYAKSERDDLIMRYYTAVMDSAEEVDGTIVDTTFA